MRVSTRVLALCFGVSLFFVATENTASAQALEVVPVPWNALDTTIPHQAYNDKQITFKAIARGGTTGTWTYRWDFDGDGTFDFTTGSTTDRYNLAATYTFTGVTTTTTYNAVVEVTNDTEVVTGVYPIRVFADVPTDPTTATARQLQVMRGVAVDDALWYMHDRMAQAASPSETATVGASQITGSIYSGNGGRPNYLTNCATLVWGMALNGHFLAYPPGSYVGTLPNEAENDTRWNQDPYAETVTRCVNYLLANAAITTGLPAIDEDNRTGTYPEVAKTPIAGTDDGVGINFSGTGEPQTYATGHVLSALSVARLTGYVAQVGNFSNVLGRTMEHIIQQVVDFTVYAQGDNSGDNFGGWHYTSNQAGVDLSTHLWSVTGLWHAEEFMGDDGVIVNNYTKARMLNYLEWRGNTPAAGQRCGAYSAAGGTSCSFTINAAHIFLLGWIGANTWDAADPFAAFPGWGATDCRNSGGTAVACFPNWGTTSPTRGTVRARYDEFLAYTEARWLTSYTGPLQHTTWNAGLWGATAGSADWTRTDFQGNHYAMLHYQDAARAVVPEITEFSAGNVWADQFSIFLVNNQRADGRYESVNGTHQNETDRNAYAPLQTGWAVLILSPDALPPLAIAQASVATANEGDTISFDGESSDPGTANPSYTWDFANGDTLPGRSVNYAFPDNGSYAVTLTSTSLGGTSVDTVNLTINNVAPTGEIGGDVTIDEGDSHTFGVAITDPGTADTHTVGWVFGDSNTGTGTAPSNTYVDNGTFNVVATTTDDDGGNSADTMTVTVNNVAPAITSTPGTTATEGVAYSYTLTFTDVGVNDTHTCSDVTLPAGMTRTDCTVDWTPDFAASVGSSAPVEICVTDNDGGQTCQSWNIGTTFTDTDSDGLPDSWEVANFGDITSQDQFGDPDADGLNNLQEFTGVTDPNVFDGPGGPTAVDPTCGTEIGISVPTLVVNNAVDPQAGTLTYQFEVYRDAALNLLVAQVDNYAEGAGGQTSWTLPNALDENTQFYWRVRAKDAFTAGAWSAVCDFFVNVVNDAPGVPGLNTPGQTSQVNSFTPTLIVDNAVDPDRDPLTYSFEVYSDANLLNLVDSGTAIVEGGSGTTSFVVTTTLTEDTRYWWRARATDDESLDGEWSAAWNFFVTTANNPPEAPTILTPQNGTIGAQLQPFLTILNSDDSDFDPLSFEYELAADDTFATILESSTQIPAQGINNTVWQVPNPLTENETYCWRVRANDGQATSAWVVACFLVSEVNDPPGVPVLMNPSADSTVRAANPGYSWVASTDPEGDAVQYNVRVLDSGDAEVTSQAGISGNSIQLNFDLEDGATYKWQVQAVDVNGAESEWATVNTFTVDIRDGGDIVVNGSGCSVGAGSSSGATFLLLLGMALLIGRRRRK